MLTNFKIIEGKLIDNVELIKNSSDINNIGIIEEKTMIKCYNNNTLISWCVISKTTEKLMKDFFKYDVNYLEDYEKEQYTKDFMNCIYIDLIKSEVPKQGGATAIISYLKNKYNKIWLYSTFGAMDFYDKMNFNNYDGEYIYYI